MDLLGRRQNGAGTIGTIPVSDWQVSAFSAHAEHTEVTVDCIIGSCKQLPFRDYLRNASAGLYEDTVVRLTATDGSTIIGPCNEWKLEHRQEQEYIGGKGKRAKWGPPIFRRVLIGKLYDPCMIIPVDKPEPNS